MENERRCPEDIDPKSEDIAKKRRRARRRHKPDPSPALAAEKAKVLARALKRPLSPGIMYEPKGRGHYLVTAPHSDLSLWELQIADAFGTRSQSVMRHFVRDLRNLCGRVWDEANGGWKPKEYELNAILAMVADLRPRNTSEAGLAAQLVAIHLLTMRMAAQALNGGHIVMEREAALTGKLARTYAMQLETYQGLRGKRRTTRQTIKVTKDLHQHVHYHDHREGDENERQSHERRRAANAGKSAIVDKRAALPSPDEGGRIVPMPGSAREA